jgi:hypothetical protein
MADDQIDNSEKVSIERIDEECLAPNPITAGNPLGPLVIDSVIQFEAGKPDGVPNGQEMTETKKRPDE